MSLTPAIHQIFFFLSMLFGVDTPMIGQQAIVKIQTGDKTGSITYQNVVTSGEMTHQAKSALNFIDEASSLDNRIQFMELINQEFMIDEGHLHVKVLFRYQDEQMFFESMGFDVDEQGDVSFKILEKETLLHSNGTREADKILWPYGTPEIHFEIAGEVLSEAEKKASVSLVKFWEK
jgi:hypothetical protein